MDWILIMLLHSFFKGGRQIAKKKSMEKSTMAEVLFFYTLYSIVLIILMTVLKIGGNIADMSPAKIGLLTMLMIATKSFIIFIAWICELRSLQKLPVGIHGILDLARVIFCTILGVVFLQEHMGITQLLGMIIVCAGILMLQRFSDSKNSIEDKFQLKYAMLALVSCFLNSITSLMDKKLMSTGLSPSSLQFWYVLFLTPFYLLFLMVKRIHIDFRSVRKNHWIFLLALMFVLADRSLFIANKIPESRLTIMTLIKQSSVFVTIIGGYFVFHEKGTGYKLICASVVCIGILISSLL